MHVRRAAILTLLPLLLAVSSAARAQSSTDEQQLRAVLDNYAKAVDTLVHVHYSGPPDTQPLKGF
jgi:hypothetical protein